jgi:serine/threonine protein kinase
METDISLQFNGTNEIIRIIDTRQSIVDYLTEKSSLCPLIGSKIKMTKELGKGEFGAVYDINSSEGRNSRYVVKQKKIIIVSQTVSDIYTLGDEAINLSNQFDIPYNIILNLNGGVAERVMNPGDIILLPENAKRCLIIHNDQVQYYCENEFYSEYVLSVLVAELYKNGQCIHFVDVFDFATCVYETEKSYQYIFMEKIDSNFREIQRSILDKSSELDIRYIITNLIVQTLFAIACYQQIYKLSHNDLHRSNIFIQYIHKDISWNSQNLNDAKYFMYRIGDKNIYIKNMGFVVKIGDWGNGCKHSEPIICNKTFKNLKNKFLNQYSPQYDLLFFLYNLLLTAGKDGETLYEHYNLSDQLFRDMGIDYMSFRTEYVYKQKNGRIAFRGVEYVEDANYVLRKGEYIKQFTLKPDSDRIIELGYLD